MVVTEWFPVARLSMTARRCRTSTMRLSTIRCCEPAAFNVAGSETMVWFHALRDGVWYYVEIGVYK